MTPRTNPFTFILVFTFLAGLANAQRPNILLILSDDHSLPHVGAYGGNCQELGLTPNLEVEPNNTTVSNSF